MNYGLAQQVSLMMAWTRYSPDQYRATMMIATIRNAAISESPRSNFFDRSVAAVASTGNMTQTS
jgi:hypothetical protein